MLVVRFVCIFWCLVGRNQTQSLFQGLPAWISRVRSRYTTLIGITIDSKLQFQSHVEAICKTANQKVKAFSRIAGYLQKHKAYVLYKTFIRSTFNYCPLIWMFCGKTANNRINQLHKRALRVLHNDYAATFEHLEKSEEVTVHCSNLQS